MRAIYLYYQALTWDYLLVVGFLTFTLASALGSVIDRMMQDRGFGIMGNALLLIVGVLGGVAIAMDYQTQIGSLSPGAYMLTLAVAAPTVLLIACSMCKSWLLGQ